MQGSGGVTLVLISIIPCVVLNHIKKKIDVLIERAYLFILSPFVSVTAQLLVTLDPG